MDWYVTFSVRCNLDSYLMEWRVGADLGWCIVIILIAAEILVAAVNIVVDLYAGVD